MSSDPSSRKGYRRIAPSSVRVRLSPCIGCPHSRDPARISGRYYPFRGALLTPVFLRLSPHRLARRVLALEPVGRTAAAVGRVPALRHDAFEAHLASMGEYGRAVGLN